MTPEVELCGPPRLILLNGEVFVADDRQPGGSVEIGLLSDGWKVHSGSECPVGADERVEVVFRCHPTRLPEVDEADTWRWSSPDPPSPMDIVAYRLAPNPTHQEAEARGECDHTWSSPKLGEPPVFCTKCLLPKVTPTQLSDKYQRILAEAQKARDPLDDYIPKPAVASTLSTSLHPQPIAPTAEDMIRAAYERALKSGSWQGMLECGRALTKLSELQPITPEKAS